MAELVKLLDYASSAMMRNSLMQRVAFVLFRGEAVWCRHLCQEVAQELWDVFITACCKHNAVTTSTHGGSYSDPQVLHHSQSTTAASVARMDAVAPGAKDMLPRLPSNVWKLVMRFVGDPRSIPRVTSTLLLVYTGMHNSTMAED